MVNEGALSVKRTSYVLKKSSIFNLGVIIYHLIFQNALDLAKSVQSA